MEYTQKITLDLNAKSAPPIIYAKQGDADTRILEVHIMEDGNEYQPEPGTSALYRVLKPDGTYIGDDGGGEIAGLSNNIVYIRLSEQALAAAGRALVDVLLYKGTQYLSTMSFILNIQSAPTQVMRGVVSTNEYAIFSSLMSSLGEALGSVASYATRAETAASRAETAANNFNLTAGDPMEPGEDPTITGTAPSYTVRLPSIKPMAAISINESGEAASATVTVEDFPEGASVPAGLNSDLIKVFNFGITLPSGRNVQIDNTLTQQGQAADAAAVGSALNEKYTMPSSGIPLSDLESGYIIPIANGGTGASDSASALASLGAQAMIQASDFSIPSTSWASDSNNGFYCTWDMPLNNVNLQGAVPHFIASPNSMTGWSAAVDAGMGPPSAAAPASESTTWPLTFYCESSPTTSIDITVYWW